jgi:hypothetical protein
LGTLDPSQYVACLPAEIGDVFAVKGEELVSTKNPKTKKTTQTLKTEVWIVVMVEYKITKTKKSEWYI